MGRTVLEGHLIMCGGSRPELRQTDAPSPCRVGALLATATIFKVTGQALHQRRCCRPRSWPPNGHAWRPGLAVPSACDPYGLAQIMRQSWR